MPHRNRRLRLGSDVHVAEVCGRTVVLAARRRLLFELEPRAARLVTALDQPGASVALEELMATVPESDGGAIEQIVASLEAAGVIVDARQEDDAT